VSAQPLVFEGPDPEKLLIEAWAKHGTSVRISEPECVRTGGIYGFFSKLHYRIEVEPISGAEQFPPQASQAATAPQRPRRVTRPAASRVAPARGAVNAASHRASTLDETTSDGDATHAGTSTGTRSPADRLGELVEATTDVLEIHGSPRRSFDEVLAGVASSLGEDPALVGTDLLERVDRPEHANPPTHAGASEPAGQPADTDRDVPAESHDEPASPAEAPPVAEGHGLGGGSRMRLGEDTATARPSTQPRHAAADARALASIGVPCEIVERARATTGAWDLAEAVFAQLPPARPLPTVDGALVAIVGELGRALELGGRIADELGLDDTELAVASPSRPSCAFPPDLTVTDDREAAALSPGWRRDRVGIVAVDATSSGASAGWVRQILRSLRPSATLAVVSAVSKPEDIAHFAAAIGGVDALALDDMELTVTPAAVIGLGIPVARLGDLPATTATWSASVAHLLVPTSAPVRAR
jgi:hypothetical protein